MAWLDDFQRRLARAGARGIGHEIAGKITRTVRGESADVWATATTEDPAAAQTPPECAWCPVCRAIRAARGANPDLASRVGGTADVVMSAAADMASAIESALSRLPGPDSATGSRPRQARPSAAAQPADAAPPPAASPGADLSDPPAAAPRAHASDPSAAPAAKRQETGAEPQDAGGPPAPSPNGRQR